MTPSTVARLRTVRDALRCLAGAALLAGGFVALCRLADLATVP
ncbi:hypothetical protein [Belnapia rosea]|uniref:Uncharacterized protein n=1 Tax=Belnapia rosea TaxID=938405 RepID=A0A1G6RNJ8_9PROT|nr:hypothetical protein [Belnapia rosea]SDD06260.1 hypothetical protein SAMN04487779_100480 [Belnapia rosea]